MSFASPLWLLGLMPWAGATIWLLLGRRQRVGVPFIKLWRGQTQSPRAKPFLTRPPPAVLLAILALLLTVLASARPMFPSRTGPPITIIVDRGITMSAQGDHAERFKETCDHLATPLLQAMGSGPVRLIPVPGGEIEQLDRTNWTTAVVALTPTFEKSQTQLASATQHALAEDKAQIIVVSDQPVPADPRVIQIHPEHGVSNVTIATVAARANPRAEVMVELRDQACPADFRNEHVHVESDGHIATRDVQVPRDGSATDFIDLPALGPVVSITVDAPDDLAIDNRAWLAREQSAAIIEDSPALPEPLRRMIRVYRRNRQSTGSHVRVVIDPTEISPDQPAIVVAPDSSPPSQSALHVDAHPITANVDWAPLADAVGGTPPQGWKPVVSKGSSVLVAVRDQPARGVWVCLNSPNWPTQTDYVIFWTNVFDWIAGEEIYRWHPLDGHDPGIVKQTDGSMRAYNAINVNFPSNRPNDWTQLHTLAHSMKNSTDLTPPTCLLALLLMAIAILVMTTN